MHVVFVHDLPETESLGVACLAGALHAAGHRASVLIAAEEEDWLGALRRLEPDLLGFSLVMGAQAGILQLGRHLHHLMPEVPKVVGGPYLSTKDDVVLEPWVDFATRTEGEELIVELLQALAGQRDYDSIAGLMWKRDGELVRNGDRQLVQDLDTLPLPDRGVYYRYPFLAQLSVKRFVAGRGCPFACSFCHVSGMREAFKGLGKYTRSKSPERIVAEIRSVQSQARLDHVHFSDDVFFFRRPWLRGFLEVYREEIGLPFTCNLTADLIDDGTVQLLAKAGCSGVSMGVESGDEEMRVRLLNKRIDNDTFLQMAASLRRHGIQLYTNNMVGLPGETLDQALSTLDFNRQLGATFARCSIATPLENLPLNDWARQRGLLPDDYDSANIRDMRTPKFVCENPEAVASLRALWPLLVKLPLPRPVTRQLLERGDWRVYDWVGLLGTIEHVRSYYGITWRSGALMAAHLARSRMRWSRIEPTLTA